MTSLANPAIMYDGITPAGLPANAAAVAGYVNGFYAWPTAAWARFPRSAKVRIDVLGTAPTLASVVDRERFDAGPAEAAAFIAARNAFRPGTATAYCSRANLPELLAATGDERFWLWLAEWSGRETAPLALALPTRVTLAACQYAHFSPYDVSAVYSSAWLSQHAALFGAVSWGCFPRVWLIPPARGEPGSSGGIGRSMSDGPNPRPADRLRARGRGRAAGRHPR